MKTKPAEFQDGDFVTSPCFLHIPNIVLSLMHFTGTKQGFLPEDILFLLDTVATEKSW